MTATTTESGSTTGDLEAFRTMVRERLAGLADEFAGTAAGSGAEPGAGSDCDRIAAVEELRDGHEQRVRTVRAFQRALYDAGIAVPSRPVEYGGMGLTRSHDDVLDDVLDELGFPTREALFVGLNIVAPAVLEHAEPSVREAVLPALYRGEKVGCQLFSEPGAGSDLAGVATRAVRDGDEWILTGQKVWTSMAHLADIGEVLVRTDPGAAKHAGLTMFLVDMDAPGVTVRPIRQMTGGAAFNEVFLDGVRVPDRNRIGPVGEGWRVAATSLGSERSSMSGAAGPVTPNVLERVAALVHRNGADRDPDLAVRLARTVAAAAAMRAAPGLSPGSWSHSLGSVSGSVMKMLMASAADGAADLAQEVLGAGAFIDDGSPDSFAWSEFILGVPALHIAGGTDEIQLNVIAQRGLGLPRPPKAASEGARG